VKINDGLEEGLDRLLATRAVLWGTREMALVWNLNREYVTDHIVKKPDFPQPALNLSNKTRRWRRDEVEAWRRKHAGR
jgi:predicted DNA-binding transcriptional regulator AlpA